MALLPVSKIIAIQISSTKARAFLTTPGTFQASTDIVSPKVIVKNSSFGDRYFRTLRRSVFMDSERKFLGFNEFMLLLGGITVPQPRRQSVRSELDFRAASTLCSTQLIKLFALRQTSSPVSSFLTNTRGYMAFFLDRLVTEAACGGLHHTSFFPKTSVPACASLGESLVKTLYIPDESLD